MTNDVSHTLHCRQGFPFEVVPSQFEETLDKSLFPDPRQYAVKNSREKATEVASRLQVGTNTTSRLQVGTNTTSRLQVGTNTTSRLQVGTNTTSRLQVGTNTTSRLQVGTNTTSRLQVVQTPPALHYVIVVCILSHSGSAGLGGGGRSRHYSGRCGLVSAVCVVGVVWCLQCVVGAILWLAAILPRPVTRASNLRANQGIFILGTGCCKNAAVNSLPELQVQQSRLALSCTTMVCVKQDCVCSTGRSWMDGYWRSLALQRSPDTCCRGSNSSCSDH